MVAVAISDVKVYQTLVGETFLVQWARVSPGADVRRASTSTASCSLEMRVAVISAQVDGM